MYKLICVSFDGETVEAKTGTFQECENYSADMESRWFFYPFHFICTEKGTIVAPGIGLIEMNKGKAFSEALFKNRKLKTALNVFKKAFEYCQNNEIEEIDPMEFEEIIIGQNRKMIDWNRAAVL